MAAIPWDDPLVRATLLLRQDRPWIRAALLLAATSHAAVAWALPGVSPAQPAALRPPLEVIDIDPTPLPPPAPPSALPVGETPPARITSAASRATRASQASHPATAVAPHVAELTAAPLDFTGDGEAAVTTSYVAGANAAGPVGPETAALPPARTASMPARPARTKPDASKRPEVAGGREWKCPFPPEADAEAIDEAVATLRVAVDASGAVFSVTIVADPGHGFGREARACAMARSWTPALDTDGKAVRGEALVAVRFAR